ncbi:TatD family hydrolase [Hungatella hominis]|uniref:TatD family hydrolase n=1 Tax=Hungatella hominis TaxID=2763050 RepID=A0ABR7HBT9_9FIRM|nr:TatD family hydrolase [Hungatella hominis]MBC5710647.1 TatD family hydrolase [Hungatella hominis]
MIFDTHAHYDDEQFDEDREELLASMQAYGVEAVTNIGASLASSQNTIELTKKYPFVYGAIGVHPNEVDELNEDGIAWLKENSALPKIVAVGEIGLDYYWDEPGREVQKKWFLRQLELAREVKLPVVIHSRDAAKDTLDIMKSFHAENLGGVIHCFSYTKEMAREYLNMGFYLGIGGVVTFKNAKKLKEVVEYMPMEQMVLETDCPYLSPVPNRGKRNSSLNLPYVVEEVARLKEISVDEVIEITNRNAKTMYRL